jgi:hypothetical protein
MILLVTLRIGRALRVLAISSAAVLLGHHRSKGSLLLSSCEAEYVAAVRATCQGIWLSRLIADMLGTRETTVKLHIDNMSAIALNRNPVYHDRSKHIDTKYHFLRQCIEEGKEFRSLTSSPSRWDE